LNRDELRVLMKQAGVRPRRSSGQNFLVEEDLARAIARDGEVQPTDVVLEIGTGFGVLTEHLCPLAAHVVSVEKDRKLQVMAADLLSQFKNLTIHEGDVLKTKNALAPDLLEVLHERVGPEGRLRVVANLPYNIATSLILLLLSADLPLDSIVVMVQLEAAERFGARHGDDSFGAVSLLCDALCERIELVRTVPRDVFMPRPKVTSAVVRLVPRPERHEGYEDLSLVVRGLFNYRRKNVLKAAKLAGKANPELVWLADAVRAIAPDPSARPEDLSLSDFRRLAASRA